MYRTTILGGVVLALAAAPAPRAQTTASVSAPPVPVAGALTVPSGEKLVLELETALHTRTTRVGQEARFRTANDVMAGGQVAIPRATPVRATVTKVQRPGMLAGRAEIRLRFDEISMVDGTHLPLRATMVRAGLTDVTAGSKGGTDPTLKGEAGPGGSKAAVINGGIQGAILGTMIGGAKGAGYGGAIGAGVGLAGVLLKRGPDLELPPAMLFELRVDQALGIPAASARRAAEIARATAPAPASPGVPVFSDNPDPAANPAARPRLERRRPGGGDASAPPVETASAPPVIPPAEPSAGDPSRAPARLPAPSSDPSAAPDPGAYKVSVAVQLVQVDAVVRDRSGQPMDRLTRGDFRLLEDGVEQQIHAFSKDESPLAVALVLDRSGSVAPFMNELRDAAYRALMQLKRGDQVALFSFAGQVERLEDLTTDRQRIANRIATIRAGGGTNIVDALFDATYYLGAVAPDRRRAIILVSDNVATTKPRANEGQMIRMAMESETVVYSIKTPGEAIPLTMRIPTWLGGSGSVAQVVQETGGEIIEAGQGSLDGALATVISRLRLRYTLGFYPSSNRATGFHKVDVLLVPRFGRAGQDYTVHARRGYYPPGTATTQARP